MLSCSILSPFTFVYQERLACIDRWYVVFLEKSIFQKTDAAMVTKRACADAKGKDHFDRVGKSRMSSSFHQGNSRVLRCSQSIEILYYSVLFSKEYATASVDMTDRNLAIERNSR